MNANYLNATTECLQHQETKEFDNTKQDTTTTLLKKNYVYNNDDDENKLHEGGGGGGTNHTKYNPILTSILHNSKNNIKDLEAQETTQKLSNSFDSNKNSFKKVFDYELQPKHEDLHLSNDNRDIQLKDKKIFSTSINQLYLNKSTNLNQIENNNYDIILNDNKNDNFNTSSINTNKQDNPDLKLKDKKSNNKFKLPNFGISENSYNNNNNKIASSQYHHQNLMHPASFSTTSSFDSSGLLDNSRGTFTTAAPAGVKSLRRKNDDYFQTFATNRETSGINVNSSNTNTNNNNLNSAMFHPTWDEWKRSHLNEKNNINNNLNESISFAKTNSDNFSNKQRTKNELNENKNTFNTSDSTEKNTTTRNFIEETIRHKNSSNNNNNNNNYQNHSQSNYTVPNTNYQVINNSSSQKTRDMYLGGKNDASDVFNQATPIVIHDNSRNQRQQQDQIHQSKQMFNSNTNTNSNTKSRHYPVYPFDGQPNRPPSPVRLSSIVLAKQPPIDVDFKDYQIEQPKMPQPEPQQPKKLKTIMSTQKRKDSAPTLTGWRAGSESDTDTQNRLLAKASGSIPIEYLSIRIDPKPNDKKTEKSKKSITTGTNTSTDRGKRIASTNTNQEELPQYNLHVSLDSLFVKSRREASTSTDRKNKNAATETEIKQRDAGTVTDVEDEPEPPPPPPPQPQEHFYRSRKSRYTEWETASTPPEPTYKLEFLTKSPRTVIRKNFQSHQHAHCHERVGNFLNDDDHSDICQHALRVDDDDRIIFGSSTSSAFNHNHNHHHHQEQYSSFRRSGSFPSLCVRPVPVVINNPIQTKRYIKHTHTYTPIIQHQQFAATYMPLQNNMIGLLPMGTSNGCLHSQDLNQHFDQFNSKFSQVFGNQTCIQQHVEPQTQRYYKFSRTTSDNVNPVATFGEIYQRQNSSSSRAHRQSFESSNNNNHQFSSSSVKSPIIEMPATPESTLGRQRFFSSSSSTAGGNMSLNNKAAYSSGYNSFSQGGNFTAATSTSGIGGPSHATLSPTPIFVNHENNNGYSSSSSIQKTFEPEVKSKSHNYVSSSSSSKIQQQQKSHKGYNKEEEEEELFNLTPNQMDSDKQFRPIYQPVINETSFAASTRTTPIPVINAPHSKKRTNNYSASSFETSQGTNQQQQNTAKWNNGFPQRFSSTQTIAN